MILNYVKKSSFIIIIAIMLSMEDTIYFLKFLKGFSKVLCINLFVFTVHFNIADRINK